MIDPHKKPGCLCSLTEVRQIGWTRLKPPFKLGNYDICKNHNITGPKMIPFFPLNPPPPLFPYRTLILQLHGTIYSPLSFTCLRASFVKFLTIQTHPNLLFFPYRSHWISKSPQLQYKPPLPLEPNHLIHPSIYQSPPSIPLFFPGSTCLPPSSGLRITPPAVLCAGRSLGNTRQP